MEEILVKRFGNFYFKVLKDESGEKVEIGTYDGMWSLTYSDKVGVGSFMRYLINNAEDGENIVYSMIIRRYYLTCVLDKKIDMFVNKELNKIISGKNRLDKDNSKEFIDEMKEMSEMTDKLKSVGGLE